MKKIILKVLFVVSISTAGFFNHSSYANDSCWKETLAGAGIVASVGAINKLKEVIHDLLTIDINVFVDISEARVEFCKRYTDEKISSVNDLLKYEDEYVFVCREITLAGNQGPETRKLTGDEAIKGIFSGDFYLLQGILFTEYTADVSLIIEKIKQIK